MIALTYFNLQKTDNNTRLFAILGVSTKMLGGFAFLMVYTFYFNRLGDTFAYLSISKKLYLLILEKPSVLFELFTPFAESKSIDFYQFIKSIDFYADWDTYTVILFSTFINFFSFGEPFTTTIIFSAISFLGLWQLFLIIKRIFPTYKVESIIATLFVPSVVFWGSGVLKDTLVMGFLGYFINAFFKVFHYNEINFRNLFWIIISSLVVALIKPYIILSLIPAILFYILSLTIVKVKNIVVKAVILPLVVLIISATSVYGIIKIGEFFPQYSTGRVLETAEKYQFHHYAGGNTNAEGAGSGYTLGGYNSTFIGILGQVPSSINVTLFRPYLWEIRNPGMLISAIESVIFLLLTIYILFKTGIVRSFQIIKQDSFLIFSTTFFLFFAFAVGFTSYNFGALARYKIPCMPFFIFTLLFLYRHSLKEKKKMVFLRR